MNLQFHDYVEVVFIFKRVQHINDVRMMQPATRVSYMSRIQNV